MSESFLSAALRKGKEYGNSIARGVPQMATGFVDLLGAPLTMTGMVKPENVFGSTEYLTNKGLLPPKQDGLDNETTELVSSILSPAGAAKGALGGMAALAALGTKKVGGSINDVLSRTVQAPKEVDVGKKFLSGDKKGIYRGSEAFGGIDQKKLKSMRAEYLRKMETGTPGRMWYDESSDDIYRWVGENPQEADKMANALAITSSRTPVAPNLMYANKGWNQNLVGDEVKSGGFPTTMGASMKEAFDNPEAAATGLKRSPFSAGLSVKWMGEDFANRPTHDIHDVRAWGIKDPKTGKDWSKGVGDAGHRFLDEQGDWVTKEANRRNLGGVEDWTPYRSQAAAWIAQKAAKEGMPIAETAKHYGSYAPDYQALLTREWGTFPGSEHIPESVTAPDAVRKAFANDMESVVTGTQGIDKVARGIGALTDKTLPNVGFYEGMANPGFTSRINVGKASGSDVIDPASEKVADAIAAYHGLVGTQKQAAWNYLSGNNTPASRAGAVQFKTPDGSPMSPEQLASFREAVTGAGGDIPMVDPMGARSLLFSDPGKETQGIVKALRALGTEQGLEVNPLTRSGKVFPSIDEYGTPPEKWSARPFIEKIEAGGDKVVANVDKVSKEIAPQLLSTVEKHASANGWTQAPWYRPMMEALADGGIAKLKELVNKGVVPVVTLGLIGSLYGEGEPENVVN
jgi:hypothetical protein